MADSVHGKLLAAAVTALQGASALSAIDDANIVQQTAPTDKSPLPALPGIILVPWGAERIDSGPLRPANYSEVIGYPILICYLAAGNQTHSDSGLDANLLIREEIIDLFIHARLSITATGVTVCDQTIEPIEVVNTAAWWDKNLFSSPLLLIVWCKKVRRAA